jgi:hypothetical protein
VPYRNHVLWRSRRRRRTINAHRMYHKYPSLPKDLSSMLEAIPLCRPAARCTAVSLPGHVGQERPATTKSRQTRRRHVKVSVAPRGPSCARSTSASRPGSERRGSDATSLQCTSWTVLKGSSATADAQSPTAGHLPASMAPECSLTPRQPAACARSRSSHCRELLSGRALAFRWRWGWRLPDLATLHFIPALPSPGRRLLQLYCCFDLAIYTATRGRIRRRDNIGEDGPCQEGAAEPSQGARPRHLSAWQE